MPSLAPRAATIRSQASTISSPPATAKPSIAAIRGLREARWTIPAKPRSPTHGRSPVTNALRSIPAENPLPAPVSTPTCSSGVSSSSSRASATPCASAPLTALRASGRLSVMSRTLSRRSVSTASAVAVSDMRGSLRSGRGPTPVRPRAEALLVATDHSHHRRHRRAWPGRRGAARRRRRPAAPARPRRRPPRLHRRRDPQRHRQRAHHDAPRGPRLARRGPRARRRRGELHGRAPRAGQQRGHRHRQARPDDASGEPRRPRAALRRQLPRAVPAHAATAPAAPRERARADRQRRLARPGAARLLRRHARARLQRRARVQPEQARADHVHDGARRAPRRERGHGDRAAPGDLHADQDRPRAGGPLDRLTRDGRRRDGPPRHVARARGGHRPLLRPPERVGGRPAGLRARRAPAAVGAEPRADRPGGRGLAAPSATLSAARLADMIWSTSTKIGWSLVLAGAVLMALFATRYYTFDP